MDFPSLESAPCPPFFIENIYEIFVKVAKNQSLTEYEYTTIAQNCNIIPSTTTEPSTSTTLKSTTISPTTPSEPTTTETALTTSESFTTTIFESTPVSSTSTPHSITTELVSTSQVASTQLSKSTTSESTTVSTISTTEPASTSHATSTQSSKSTTSASTTVSTTPRTEPASTSQATSTKSSKSTTSASTTVLTTPRTEPASTSQATSTQSSKSITLESTTFLTTPRAEPASTSQAIFTQSSKSTTLESTLVSTALTTELAPTPHGTSTQSALESTTVSPTSTIVQPVYAAASTCDTTCLVTIVCVGTIFMCICIMVMIKLKLHRNKKSRRVKIESHIHGRKYHATRLHDDMIDNGYIDSRLVWRTNPGYTPRQRFTPYQRHSRSSSNNSYLAELKPVRFVNQIYLPDNDVMPQDHLSWQTSPNILSEEYILNGLEPIYKRNSRPKQKKHKQHKHNNTVGNPHSMDESSFISNGRSPFNGPNPYTMAEPSFISNGRSPFNGPIMITSEIDRGPFSKNIIEHIRGNHREISGNLREFNNNQTRHRSQSHDPNFMIGGYIKEPSHIYPDPGIPDYRPTRRYEKHNPRGRRSRTSSKEFSFDDDMYRQQQRYN